MIIRKIDDDLLQKMLAESKSQAECARFFGCSEAAISKRVKRLSREETPESFKALAPKEQKWVLAKLEGKSSTGAALDAYDCGGIESAKTIGKRLAGDPDVKQAIADLMHEEGIGRRVRIRRLKDVIMSRDLGIASRGLDMGFKLGGEYAPQEIEITDFRTLHDDAMEALRRLREAGFFVAGERQQDAIDVSPDNERQDDSDITPDEEG